MNLYRNGFVVAKVNAENFAYHAWPLFELSDDKNAKALTDEAWDRWFTKYDMQHIVPDFDYAKRYQAYCQSTQLSADILLFESPFDHVVVEDKLNISKILGFDCIGTVYHSYLREEVKSFKAELMAELEEQGIRLNCYNLFDNIEDVLCYIGLRKKAVSSGMKIENFWEEMPVRISMIELSV